MKTGAFWEIFTSITFKILGMAHFSVVNIILKFLSGCSIFQIQLFILDQSVSSVLNVKVEFNHEKVAGTGPNGTLQIFYCKNLKQKSLDDRVKIIDIHKDEEDIRLDVINLAGVELVEQILERIQ